MEMNVKTFSVACISAVIAVLLCVTVLVPIVDESTNYIHSTTENAGYDLYYDDDFSNGVTIEISSGAKVDGDQVELQNPDHTNPGYYVFSDKFQFNWWASATSVTVSDLDLGKITNVVKLEIESDGTYTYTKSDDTTVESTNALSRVMYPSNSGEYGQFTAVPFNVNVDDVAVTVKPALMVSPYYLTITEAEIGLDSATVTLSYAMESTTFEEYDTTLEVSGSRTLSEDGLSYSMSGLSLTWTTTIDDTDYEYTNSSPTFVAPIEYSIMQATDYAGHSLVSVIPLLVLVGVALGVIGMFVAKRE